MKRSVFAAACAALFASTAMAGVAITEVFVPNFEMVAHDSATADDDPVISMDFSNLGIGNYTEMSIVFDFAEAAPDATWASDLVMQVGFANTTVDIRGSFAGSGSGLSVDDADQLGVWDFDGAGSGDDGTYMSTFSLTEAGVIGSDGMLNVSFSDVFDGGYTIKNMSILLTGIPAPGAIALLGIAGLTGRRRRA